MQKKVGRNARAGFDAALEKVVYVGIFGSILVAATFAALAARLAGWGHEFEGRGR